MSNQESPGACDSKPSSLLDNTVVIPAKPSFCTHVKIVTYGKMMDVEIFENPIRTGIAPKRKRGKELTDAEITMALVHPDLTQSFLDDRKAEYRRRTANVAQTNIRRLSQANFDMTAHFLTLTIKDNDQFDSHSLFECHKRFEIFINRFRQKYPAFKYLAVPEFQKRGAVHYHVINNLPFIPVEELRKYWSHGFIKVNQIKEPSLVGLYIAKYMSKNVHDERFKGHRLYYCSRGLLRPTVRYGDHYLEKIKALNARGIEPIYATEFKTEKNGKKQLSSYNFYNKPAQK